MKKILLTLSASLLYVYSFAQLGSIDSSFNLGTGFGPDQWTGKCETIVQQPDGKLLIGGQFLTFDGDTALYITRLNIDGSRDLGFSNQFERSWGYKVSSIALQPDGKIIIGGEFNQINGESRNRIARLNSDGSLDLSFNPASGFNQQVTTVEVQTDGKILVGGLFTLYDYEGGAAQTPVSGIARLNPDGKLDSTFTIGSGFTGNSGIGQRQVHKIKVQPDGKILVGGHFSMFNGDTAILLTRLNSNGTLDNSFNANANFSPAFDGYYGRVYSIKLLSDNKIMIGGIYGNNNSLAFGVDRLNTNGSLDTTFKISHSSEIRNFCLDVQSDGKILAANVNFGSPSEAFAVERYNTDGSLDTLFPKKFVNNEVKDLIVQNDGNITFVGYFNYNPTGIMRLIGETPLSIHSITKPLIDFVIYPNPANNLVTINNISNASLLTISDITGKTVYSQKTSNETNTTVDVSNLNSGIYFVSIVKNGGIATQKLIINN